MDQQFSRPIHLTGSKDATDQTLLNRSTRATCLSVKPGDQDVIVKFRDGHGGAILWEIEADNASGSHSDSFPSPLLFKNGLIIDVASQGSNWAVNAAVLEPMSAGT